MKTFNFLNSVALSKFGINRPLSVLNLVTFRCNLKCKYCGIWKTPRKEMTTEQIKKAMKEFADAGNIVWAFSGGEPLIRNDIGELINYGKDLGMIITLVSNGLLIPKKISEIKNLDLLILSLDGPKEINIKTRGKNSYESVLNSIKIAKDYNIKKIRLSSVISKENVKNGCYGIKEMFNIAKNFNIELNMQPVYADSYNKSTVNKCFSTESDYTKAISLIKNFKKENPKLLSTTEPCLEFLTTLNKKNIKQKCYAGSLFCYLFPDGLVAPCLFKEDQGIDGLKYGFVNAFNMLPKQDNCTCFLNCHVEYNLLFSLNFKSIKSYILRFI